MSRICLGVVTLTIGLWLTTSLPLTGQPKDTKDSKNPVKEKEPTKYRGILPANFKKLGLRDDQVQAIYKLQTMYKVQVDDLKRKQQDLKNEERDAIEKVLTPEQLKRLRELQTKGGKTLEKTTESPEPKSKDS